MTDNNLKSWQKENIEYQQLTKKNYTFMTKRVGDDSIEFSIYKDYKYICTQYVNIDNIINYYIEKFIETINEEKTENQNSSSDEDLMIFDY